MGGGVGEREPVDEVGAVFDEVGGSGVAVEAEGDIGGDVWFDTEEWEVGEGEQVIGGDEGGDFFAGGFAVAVSGFEVEAAVDAAAADFVGAGGEAGEGAGDAGQGVGGCGEGDGIGTEEEGEEVGSGLAESAMAAGVFGEVGGGEESGPFGVGQGIGVIVFVGALDSGYGSPEVVSVFSFPAGDGGVGLSEAEECEESGGVLEVELEVYADAGGDFVEVSWGHGGVGEVGPEDGDLFLVWCTGGAVEAAEGLDFEEVGGVLVTGEGRGAWCDEAFEVIEAEGCDVAPVGVERWAVEGWGTEPLAGVVTGDIGDLGGGAIALAGLEHEVGDRLAVEEAVGGGLIGGEGCKDLEMECICLGGEGGVEDAHDGVACAGGGGFGGGIGRGCGYGEVGLVCGGDGVNGVVDGGMEDGEVTGAGGGAGIIGADGIEDEVIVSEGGVGGGGVEFGGEEGEEGEEEVVEVGVGAIHRCRALGWGGMGRWQ